jgi:hypothetical protein
MGTWGSGVFENDSAGDYTDKFSYYLVDVVQSSIYQLMLNEEDYLGAEYRVMSAAYLLSIFYQELDIAPPAVIVARKWKADFLKYWDLNRKALGQVVEPPESSERKLFNSILDYIIEYAEDWENQTWDAQPLIDIVWNRDFNHYAVSRQLLDELLKWLNDDIQKNVQNILIEANDYGAFREEECLAAVKIYHVLCESCDVYPPNAEKIAYWHKLFADWWEKYQSKNGKPDYLIEHRKVIHETFDDFQHFAEAYEKRLAEERLKKKQSQ